MLYRIVFKSLWKGKVSETKNLASGTIFLRVKSNFVCVCKYCVQISYEQLLHISSSCLLKFDSGTTIENPCVDTDDNCPTWTSENNNYCTSNPYVEEHCKLSCGTCGEFLPNNDFL